MSTVTPTITPEPYQQPTRPRYALEPRPGITNCPTCHGGGVIYLRECERFGFPYPLCPTCRGAGYVLTEGQR